MRKESFSFRKHGPEVERLVKSGYSANQIAKLLGRSVQTIKNYMQYANLTTSRKEVGSERQLKSIDEVVIGQTYFSRRFKTQVIAKGTYGDAVKIWIPEFLHYAYCKPSELLK